MSTTTPNYGFQLFPANWFDQHTGLGAIDLANALLNNVDSVLSAARVRVLISQSQLQNMKATPPVILPALPPGVMAEVLFATIQYVPVSADYAIGDAANLFIASAVNPTSLFVVSPFAASILSGAGGPGKVVAKSPKVLLSGAQSQFENQPLVLTHDGSAEITSGNGTLVVSLAFQTVTL